MIYVGFSTTNFIVSRIIRRLTKSEVSHTFFAYLAFGRLWVLEAGFLGICIVPLDKFAKKNQIILLVPVKELNTEDLSSAMDRLGDAYDFGGLFGGIFPIIGHWLKRKWKNPWDNTKAMFCSELIVTTLQDAKFKGMEEFVAADTTPQELKDYFTAHYLTRS